MGGRAAGRGRQGGAQGLGPALRGGAGWVSVGLSVCPRGWGEVRERPALPSSSRCCHSSGWGWGPGEGPGSPAPEERGKKLEEKDRGAQQLMVTYSVTPPSWRSCLCVILTPQVWAVFNDSLLVDRTQQG